MSGIAAQEHEDPAASFRHAHDVLGRHHDRNARKTRAVLALTAVTMVVEIAGGLFTRSMAVLADGLHMATHAGVMLIAVGAYAFARRAQADRRFSFGPGKFGDLSAFASAVILAFTALIILLESVERLWSPQPVAYAQALMVAAGGLAVNLLSAWLLRDEPHAHHGHDHDHAHHDHDHEHEHHHGPGDLNLRAAYLHVAADAAVSVLAIVGLFAAWRLGWTWTDPVVGIVAAIVIGRWAIGLLRAAGAVLVDMSPSTALEDAVSKRLISGGETLADLHVWRIGPDAVAVIACVVSDRPLAPAAYRARLADLPQVNHVTIEVIPRDAPRLVTAALQA
ncbi:CDF family Co(II)/Ni(II) efflux transporter DmeF [soil metagenome]